MQDEVARRTLNDPALKRELQRLRRPDDVTNWYYLAVPYSVATLAIGGAIATHQYTAANGLSLWWCAPVFLLAIVLVGAVQHNFINAAHEASHYTLFKTRWLNEGASDWLCMFPMFMSTYGYRLEHLAHHQHVNSEDDPDRQRLEASGHWLEFPAGPSAAVRLLLRQLWLPNLARHILVRMQHNPMTDGEYVKEPAAFPNLPQKIGAIYTFGMFAFMAWASVYRHGWLLLIVSNVTLAAVLTALAYLPANAWPTMKIPAPRPARSTAIQRMLYIALLWNGLAWLQYFTGAPAWAYLILLWGIPTFTTFSLFLMLEQLVQHGNGDRGWITNSRVFHVNPIVRFAVFPFGTNYHLPHHMYSTVPHYNLPRLHALLLEYPEYAEEAVVAEGYFAPVRPQQVAPTALEVLGPRGAPKRNHSAYIDDSVLEGADAALREQAVAVLARDSTDTTTLRSLET